MSTTTTPTLAMYHAVLLRYQQLANNVLHPDDCCGWETEDCDTAMGALRDELERQGLHQRVDFEARQLFAQVRLARTLIDTIENAAGRLGEDIATAQSWTDAAKREAGE